MNDNRRLWEHAGLSCALRHGAFGAPCGYVLLEPGHPLHGLGLAELMEVDGLPVPHGGITYAGWFDRISDVELHVWAVGFDMAHYGDFSPFDAFLCVRTDEECVAETEWLADELVRIYGAVA